MMRRYNWENPEVDPRKGKYVLGVLICAVVFCISYWTFPIKEIGVHESHLVYEKMVINKAPEYIRTKGRGATEYYEFTVLNHKRKFRISGYEFPCVDKKHFLNEIGFGDTAVIGMLIVDYAEIDEETWSANYNRVITFKCNNREYIGRECRNSEEFYKAKLLLIASGLGIVLFSLGAYINRDLKIYNVTVSSVLIIVILICAFAILILKLWFS